MRLVRTTMIDSEAKVRLQEELTNSFKTRQELKRGDGLAPILFNLALEYVIRELDIDTKGTIINKSK